MRNYMAVVQNMLFGKRMQVSPKRRQLSAKLHGVLTPENIRDLKLVYLT
jgi:hypothetical protein